MVGSLAVGVSGTVGSVRGRIGAALVPIGLFVVTGTVGIVGFVVLAGISPVDAAFWLLDPTSIELHFQHHSGPEQVTKGFALVVFSGLIASGLWIGESVLDTVFGGQFREELRRVQTEQTIEGLSGHVVICGYGMFGRTVAQRLRRRGEDVVVVESDSTVVEAASDEPLVIEGDARREDVLERAGVSRARAVVAAIDDSNVTIQIAIVTSQLAPDAALVVRVGDETYESVARRAGADTVVIPEVVSGSDVVDGL
ncbi:potassium channel family protein [Halorientalis pallida]|uniref:Potassium channel protein n=1 Tax=Halorientalis pallida TaxID=2479928 RepID=A0A498KWV9_9EURY|nr:potassium channel protein [Halorientalis pallida]